MIIQTYDDLESLNHAAAEIFVRQALLAVKARGRFALALSGGGTPRRTYELLAQPPFSNLVPWDRTHVFWGDERCVPPADPRSNTRLAREALLDHVPLAQIQIHPFSCSPSPDSGAKKYEALLRNFFGAGPPRLDLVLLGMGADGHTASLFPYDAALKERVRWTAAVFVPAQRLHRVTFTPAFINQAAAVVFLVAGAAKATVLREVLKGPHDPRRLPAQLIKPEAGELYWLLDRDAAGQSR